MIVDWGRAACARASRCVEATITVELEDLPAGAAAILLLVIAVLLVLSV